MSVSLFLFMDDDTVNVDWSVGLLNMAAGYPSTQDDILMHSPRINPDYPTIKERTQDRPEHM